MSSTFLSDEQFALDLHQVLNNSRRRGPPGYSPSVVPLQQAPDVLAPHMDTFNSLSKEDVTGAIAIDDEEPQNSIIVEYPAAASHNPILSESDDAGNVVANQNGDQMERKIDEDVARDTAALQLQSRPSVTLEEPDNELNVKEEKLVQACSPADTPNPLLWCRRLVLVNTIPLAMSQPGILQDSNSSWSISTVQGYSSTSSGGLKRKAPAPMKANISKRLRSTKEVSALISPASSVESLALGDIDACPVPKLDVKVPDIERKDDSALILQRPVKRKRQQKTGIAKAIKYHQSEQEDKPLPCGQPPVWAAKRQQLCESLPYFHSFQSGAFSINGSVIGFLNDKEVTLRDKITEEIVISSLGGGRTTDPETGKMKQQKDNSSNTYLPNFERARQLNKPVAMIIGQGNPLSLTKMPHYYNVLAWFHVTDLWLEVINGFTAWKVRLEKITLRSKSWWAPVDSPDPDPSRDIDRYKTVKQRCSHCQKESKMIYTHGWACLEPGCEQHFKFSSDVEFENLQYNEAFLLERQPYDGKEPPPLNPTPPTAAEFQLSGRSGLEKDLTKGIVCPLCKGCCRRRDWLGWTCEYGCAYRLNIPIPVLTVGQAVTQSISLDRHFINPSIRVIPSIEGLYDVFTYRVPGLVEGQSAGFIRHFKACHLINAQSDGPNDLFRAMQVQDFGLRRNAARQKGSTGEMLTNHWAKNWGAPYKFGVAVDSTGFDMAPPVIMKALKRLSWAGTRALSETDDAFVPFNELLSIGYMESSSIGYHDDGERELGPTVASLSLGCTATMEFRAKKAVSIGPKSNNKAGTKRPMLRIILEHGDLVVMHGADIQKLYEHAVNPHGSLRFALTGRFVRPELLKSDADREVAARNGALPTGHEEFDYDGDLNVQDTPARLDPSRSERKEWHMRDIRAALAAGEISVEDLQEFCNDARQRGSSEVHSHVQAESQSQVDGDTQMTDASA